MAAMIALVIWGADRWAAGKRRKNHAQLLAVVLAPRFNSLKKELDELVGIMRTDSKEKYRGFVDNPDFRERFSRAIDELDVSKFPSDIDGFTPLSLGMGASIVDTLNSILGLKVASAEFHKLKSDAPEDQVESGAKDLHVRLIRAKLKADRAWRVCVELRPKYDLVKKLDGDSDNLLKRFALRARKVASAAWTAAREE